MDAKYGQMSPSSMSQTDKIFLYFIFLVWTMGYTTLPTHRAQMGLWRGSVFKRKAPFAHPLEATCSVVLVCPCAWVFLKKFLRSAQSFLKNLRIFFFFFCVCPVPVSFLDVAQNEHGAGTKGSICICAAWSINEPLEAKFLWAKGPICVQWGEKKKMGGREGKILVKLYKIHWQWWRQSARRAYKQDYACFTRRLRWNPIFRRLISTQHG